MIKEINIEAFRKHGNRRIELERVTTIVGPNDCGKSSVIKALMWVVFNRPQGETVIPHGGKTARVGVRVKKTWVFRTRVKNGDNSYEVGKETYKAFGTGVPDAVREELRLDEINFQRQIDPPFWLSLSPPEVAREMNRVVDLEVIDTAVAYAAGRVRSVNEGVKELQAGVTDAELTIGRLRWVSEVEAMLLDARQCEQKARVATQTIARLESTVKSIQEAQEAVPEPPDLTELDGVVAEIEKLRSRERALADAIQTAETAKESLCLAERSYIRASEDLKAATPKLCPQCGQPIEKPASRTS